MRGFIYEVSDSPNDIFSMEEDDFLGLTSMLGCSMVKKIPDEQLESMKRVFTKLFSEYGASDYSVDSLTLTDSTKKNFFFNRFCQFRKTVETMTLEDFAESDPYAVRELLENSYGDMVFYNSDLFPLDRWVRNAPVNTTLYLGNVIIME